MTTSNDAMYVYRLLWDSLQNVVIVKRFEVYIFPCCAGPTRDRQVILTLSTPPSRRILTGGEEKSNSSQIRSNSWIESTFRRP